MDRVKLLSDTVENLETQRNFPFSPEHRREWEIALNEAQQMLAIEREERKKNVRKKM